MQFPDFRTDLEQMELLLEQDAEFVKLGRVTIMKCRDPDDNRILETTVIGECGFIVSGDKDLLAIRNYEGIQIIKPAEFLELIT